MLQTCKLDHELQICGKNLFHQIHSLHKVTVTCIQFLLATFMKMCLCCRKIYHTWQYPMCCMSSAIAAIFSQPDRVCTHKTKCSYGWSSFIQSFLDFKGCVHYIFASLFFKSNESTCQTRKYVFYFTSKTLFVLEKIKFYNFRFSDLMTSSNTLLENKKYILLNNVGGKHSLLMIFGQFMSYSKRNNFIKIFYKKLVPGPFVFLKN